MQEARYILVTPARNEGQYIEATIHSVLRQTLLPRIWMIVDDNSDDATDAIVGSYANRYEFIRLLRLEGEKKRSFAAKVRAFKAGYDCIKDDDYQFIGNLDADIALGRDYYEAMLKHFSLEPRLGVAGGVRFGLVNGKWVSEGSSPWSVCAGIQLFRRRCFEDIGGYIAIDRCEDAVAEVMARMNGWLVTSFPDHRVFHLRPYSKDLRARLLNRFKYGMVEYTIGYHPLYVLTKVISRMTEGPPVMGSLFYLMGYLGAWLSRTKLATPPEVAAFLRNEQMQRLWTFKAGAAKQVKP